MSLGIAIKAPEGIVLAAESRVTLVANTPEGPLPVHFDNATKLFGFEEPNNYVGVVTYGLAAIGQRTAHSFLPELESALHAEGKGRLTVAAMAQRISDFYMAQWRAVITGPHGGPPMTLLVAGYDLNEPYGEVYQIDIPTLPAPVQHHPGQNFGVTWGGQREFVDRLLQGYDAQLLDILAAQGLQSNQIEALRQAFQPLQMRLPLNAMALQDCVDVALFFIRTTIAGQGLTVGLRGCGGHIDAATITRREGLNYVQRKKIRGEYE